MIYPLAGILIVPPERRYRFDGSGLAYGYGDSDGSGSGTGRSAGELGGYYLEPSEKEASVVLGGTGIGHGNSDGTGHSVGWLDSYIVYLENPYTAEYISKLIIQNNKTEGRTK